MKIYRVGGYVRDKLLGIDSHDCDYVVIGSSPQEMEANGFIRVGKFFPVFLHPQTKEEYALARKERKIGTSHQDFAINADSTISLEEDLSRRDITINAIAENIETGELIDPYNGINDLKNKLIRHVSSAFDEDPLRILRVARFAAKFEFSIAPSTMQLMQNMAKLPDVQTISKARILNELQRAFDCKKSSIFFKTLAQCNCLATFFPTMDKLSKNSHCEILDLLDTCNSILDKYIYLGLSYLKNGYTTLNELSLNSDVIDKINQIYILDNLDINIESEVILQQYKKLQLFRNSGIFSAIMKDYINYQQTTETLDHKKNEQLANLAQLLANIDTKGLIQGLPKNKIAATIHEAQIKCIEEFKGSHND